MRKLLLIAASVVICLAFAGEASAGTPAASDVLPAARPTFGQARQVMHTILDAYANGTDGRLTLGGCRRHHKLWIVCRARIDRGHAVTRYRFRVSTNKFGYYLISSDVTTVR